MIRNVISALAGLGALALSGCITSGSTMDLAPLDQRPAKPLFELGDYCNVEGEGSVKDTVNSAEGCGQFAFDAATRRYTVTIVEDGKTQKLPVSIVSLKQGVLLAQVDAIDMARLEAESEPDDTKRSKDDKDMPPHIHAALLVVDRAMINIGWQATDEEMDALVARHPKIKIEGKGTNRVVTAGERADILDYIWDFTVFSLRSDMPSARSVSVRDKLGAANHKASVAQARDIKAAMKKLDGMKR